MDIGRLLFLLLCGHALCDFPLQSDFMARGKRWRDPNNADLWPFCLTGHALIHGGCVTLITGSLLLGVAETMAHWYIDFGKCGGFISMKTDQALHLFCKIAWVFFLWLFALPVLNPA